MLKQHNYNGISLALPEPTHEVEYCRVMDKWETYDEKIQPPSMRRYGDNSHGNKENFSFSKWLKYCEDDRTTGSMLANNIPCTLYFLISNANEILGGIDINHANTPRGQLHAGITPWNRNKGYGTIMLNLALVRCKEMGFESIQLSPRKDNHGAIKTILHNEGILLEEFFDDDIACLRYIIKL